MKSIIIQCLFLLAIFGACSQEQEQHQPIEWDLPLDENPELNRLPNLVKTEIDSRVEKSFYMYLERFGGANHNHAKSCVYCYFTEAPEEYNQFLDYCVKNHHQTMLLLLKHLYDKTGGTLPRPHTRLVLRGLYNKVYPDSYKEMLATYDIDIPEEAISRWDLPQYVEESQKEIQMPFEKLVTAIMEKY
jgi:hypothetical protein